jgi:uncharacterized membrane protein
MARGNIRLVVPLRREGRMADAQFAVGPGVASEFDQLRAVSVLVYALYLAAALTGVTAIFGVVLAYAKRGGARGTVFEQHLDHAIELFWIALVGGVVLVPLSFLFGLGVVLAGALVIWLLARTVKGLSAAVQGVSCA